jgi:hypothetical protein
LIQATLEFAEARGIGAQLTYLDLEAAFTRADREFTFKIMEKMGFPEDIRSMLKKMYEGAAVRVQTPYGLTERVPLERGWHQGAPSSPLLFNFSLEPLLRRLAAEGNGLKCELRGGEVVEVGQLGFADDICLVSERNNQLQIDTTLKWEEATGNRLRPEKCVHTVSRLGARCKKRHKEESEEKGIHPLFTQEGAKGPTFCECGGWEEGERNNLVLKEGAIPFVGPWVASRYLGMWFNAKGSFGESFKRARAKTRRKWLNATRYPLTPQEAVELQNSWILPSLLFGAELAPYTRTQVKSLTSLAFKFTTSKITAISSADRDLLAATKGNDGLGAKSYEEEYATRVMAGYERQLNSPLDLLRKLTRENLRWDQEHACSTEDILAFTSHVAEQRFTVEAEGGEKKRKADLRRFRVSQEGRKSSRAKRSAEWNHVANTVTKGAWTQRLSKDWRLEQAAPGDAGSAALVARLGKQGCHFLHQMVGPNGVMKSRGELKREGTRLTEGQWRESKGWIDDKRGATMLIEAAKRSAEESQNNRGEQTVQRIERPVFSGSLEGLGTMVYQGDFIRSVRERGGVRQYLVRWHGYTADEDSWEPAANVTLTESAELLSTFRSELERMQGGLGEDDLVELNSEARQEERRKATKRRAKETRYLARRAERNRKEAAARKLWMQKKSRRRRRIMSDSESTEEEEEVLERNRRKDNEEVSIIQGLMLTGDNHFFLPRDGSTCLTYARREGTEAGESEDEREEQSPQSPPALIPLAGPEREQEEEEEEEKDEKEEEGELPYSPDVPRFNRSLVTIETGENKLGGEGTKELRNCSLDKKGRVEVKLKGGDPAS